MIGPAEVAQALGGAKRTSAGWLALCPLHEADGAAHDPSLDIRAGSKQPVIVTCRVCGPARQFEIIAELKRRELWPNRPERRQQAREAQREVLTVAELAKAMVLDEEHLRRRWGLKDTDRGVWIPYRNTDGSEADARIRHRLLKGDRKDNRFSFAQSGAKPTAYIPWPRRDDKVAIIVEGESDTWVLDFFNFSPIGIPGSNPKALKLEHLVGITRLYIVRESDGPAGEAFVSMMAGRLKEIGYAGAVRVIVMPIETKDPRALYRDVGATKFHDAMQALIDRAEPIDLNATQVARRSEAYLEIPALAVTGGQTPGGLFHVKRFEGGGEKHTRLTNWTAHVIADIQKDDGASEERQREFELEAQLKGNVSRFRVPARRFASLDWVPEQVGAAAMITATPNAEKKIREAVIRFSAPLDRKVFTHTGWRQFGSVYSFLHAGGAIGADGPVAGVEVELPRALRSFLLPDPVSGQERVDAIRASLGMLEVAPDRIAVSVFCAIYRAPLGPADFVVWLEGRTGVFKTELGALAQAHFGVFDSRRLPANFISTANFLEEWAFQLKDVLFLVDNFRPTGSAYDRQRAEAVADRLIQSAGDAAGRGRLNRDLSAREPKPPRGLTLGTGEEAPSGHSTLGRLFKIEIARGDITSPNLTALQGNSDQFRIAMACYIQWLASRFDRVQSEMKQRVADLRAGLSIPGAHPRTPGTVGSLLFGGATFVDFALEVGGITIARARELKLRLKYGLEEAATPQAAAQREEEPMERYLSLLRSAIGSGGGHFADRAGNRPANAEAWGWRCDEMNVWRPQGIRVGWVDLDRGELYLDPAAAYKAAAAMAADGHGVGVKETTLRRRLKPLLVRTGKEEGRETLLHRQSLEGRRREVLVLKTDVLTQEIEIKSEPTNG
jgi:hypothetical protein